MSVLGFTDIHCHIVPSVDDGAQTIEEAQKMIHMAYMNRTRRIIATPHYGNHRCKASKGEIVVRFLELSEWVDDHYPGMKLYLGQELAYHHGLEERLQQGKALTMAGSRYVLVEFEPSDEFSRIRQGLEHIQMAGYWPILAHAERCLRLAENIEYVEMLVHQGVYIQINARSVTGENGWRCKSFTKKLLKRELVHFVASDGHDTKERIPSVKNAMEIISKRYGKGYAQRLFVINPMQILKDNYID